MVLFGVFLLLGAFGGFLSGLLGIGGALIMIPLMLEVPPLFGLDRLNMQAVAGLSMLQVVFASLSGVLRHHKNQSFHGRLFVILAACMSAASLIGAVLSKWMPETALMLVFGIMLIGAACMLFMPSPGESSITPQNGGQLPFHRGLAALIGTGVGLMAGMVGAGGGFLIVPLMIYGLHIPIRITVGTSLGVVLAGGAAGAIGKIMTGQVLWLPAIGLILGSVVMAQAGAIISHKTSTKALRLMLVVIVLLSGIQIWRDIILRLI